MRGPLRDLTPRHVPSCLAVAAGALAVTAAGALDSMPSRAAVDGLLSRG